MSLTNPTLAVRLHAISYAAAGINFYEFRPLDGQPLPAFSAGAHIDLHLANGLVRQYSLCNGQDERHRYVVGVKQDPKSRGGSRWIHEQLRVGALMTISQPRNNFALLEDAPASVLIAGGIGVTPMASMVARLCALGRDWELHYSVRCREDAVTHAALADPRVHLHVDAEQGGAWMDIAAIVRAAAPQAHLYCCGPAPMLAGFQAAARHLPPAQVHLEHFGAVHEAAAGGGFALELARSGRRIQVCRGQTIIEALRGAGVAVQTSCEQGICGVCETRVLAGTPDHRDGLLSEQEKAANTAMMICCSGSRGELLVLDL
jgi:vanillate O-demethylase ferredoxin subunit